MSVTISCPQARQRRNAIFNPRDLPVLRFISPILQRGHRVSTRPVMAVGKIIHALCTTEEPVFLITCYEPDPDQWYNGFRIRRSIT